MAHFTITIGGYNNLPPNQIGTTTIDIDSKAEYVFSIDDFTLRSNPIYQDPEGDPLSKIKILTLPGQSNSFLEFNGIPVNIGDEISADDIDDGQLKYISDVNAEDQYDDIFSFDVADEGSNTFGGLEGFINITVLEFQNEPPVVGDGEATIDYGQTLVFTRDMFTTLTQPPYNDPEGDAALELQIISLPTDGTIKLDGTPVIINQIIPFSDIDAGLLTYVPDLEDVDGDIEGFDFAISDAGSGEFVQ